MTPSQKQILARPHLRGAIDALRDEFQRGRLTLYLGAGVSRESGLPNWNTLIASLYYSAISADWKPQWIAFPNYLYALGEWLLMKSGEPPEVIAGKIESYYGSNSGFAEELKGTLYLPWQQTHDHLETPSPQQLRGGNALLDAVAKLCEATVDSCGLHAVVTTNYDSLLEQSISQGSARDKFRPIWKSAEKLPSNKKGIFHVHGYLPADGDGSPYGEIMLTEAQYHGAASDPYSWSNLTLIQCFSASTGLMIGMSMADRNLRRLLHALHRTQLSEKQYVILKKPEAPMMNNCDLQEVTARAVTYANRFAGSGIKKGDTLQKMQGILEELVRQEKMMAEKTLASMGVTPLWVEEHNEIPVIVEAVGQ
jgi:SIR2-like domain